MYIIRNSNKGRGDIVENFCLITNIPKDKDLLMTKLIIQWLGEHNKKVFLQEELAVMLGLAGSEHSFSLVEEIAGKVDCAIILGGDGTILGSARALALHSVPIIGVNLGTLGFLAEIEKENVIRVLDNIIQEKYIIENRMMLSVEIVREGKLFSSDIADRKSVV